MPKSKKVKKKKRSAKKKRAPKKKRIVAKKKPKSKKIIKKKARVKLRKKAKRKKRITIKLGRPKKVFTEEKFQQLLEKGKERGFVTYSEILYYFPAIERDIKGLERLYDDFEKAGIEVQEVKELITIGEKVKKPKASESRIDPIQMYLKEIGKLSFVTAAEEKELAKKIEKGDLEAKKKLAKANLRLVEFLF